MNPSTQIRKRRAPLQQIASVLRRRSSRIRSRQGSVSIFHTLGSYYESQSSLDQRPINPQPSQPVGATSLTRVPTSGPVEALPIRKREFDISLETGAERPLKRACLTQRNLKALENMGGQRRKAARTKSSRISDEIPQSWKSNSSYRTKSTQSKTISTTDSSFQDIAFQNGILNPNCSKRPENLESRRERIDRNRETASPTELEYQCFASTIRKAPNEATLLNVTSKLLQYYKEPGYHQSYNQALNNFPKNVGFNNGLSPAQPDMIEGFDLTQFAPFPAREQLGGAAALYSGPEATTLPHVAGEWKGQGKDMIQAQTQAAYDGACIVYGRNKALLLLGNSDPADHALVSTFTTDGNTVNIFAHYSSETQGQVKYHQYPESTSLLISSYEDFKTSRKRLRNVQDYAKEASEKLRNQLREEWLANRPPVAPSADPTDYNSYDYGDEEDPSNQLLAEYWNSLPTIDQSDSSRQIPTKDNKYAPPNGLLVTPPQSLEDTSLQPSQPNRRDHKRTRPTRQRKTLRHSILPSL